MPDYLEPVHSTEGQPDWHAMFHDLEKRIEVLSDALEGVKLSMRRLVLAEPWLEGAALPPPEPQAAPVETHRPYLVEAPDPVAEVTPPPAVEYDDDAREAVRRAVEEAKSQMASGDWHDEVPEFIAEDKPEVSWVTVPDDGSEPEPLPVIDEVPSDFADDEDAREAVRRAVEEAKAELSLDAPPGDDEAVRRDVEQPKSEMGFGWGSVGSSAPPVNKAEPALEAETPEEDPEVAREAARQAIEAAKTEMGFGWGSVGSGVTSVNEEQYAPEAETPDEDPEAARETARQAIEAAKAEMGFATASNAPSATTGEDEEAAREAVRQAVQQARAEMVSGRGLDPDAKPVEVAPKFVVPPPHRPERVHPPTLTIEDPEGRVELARVYNLLKRLDVAANSSLLNYSSRQVAVQLSDSKSAPDGENVGEAVRDVFERENDVSVDGLNVIVKLGNDYIRAA